jgi:four helix bundle protein
MKIDKFEDILAWQKGRELTLFIYKSLQNCKDYSYKDQICRASISICNNIAEGYERRSNKELKHFLFIAKGSAGEVRSMLHIGLDLGYFTKTNYDYALNLSLEISKILSGFIRAL